MNVINFRFVCKKFRISFSLNSPIIINLNTGIKRLWAKIRNFVAKPRTYRGLQKFGSSKFIDTYGRPDFKKLVRKGIKKKQYKYVLSGIMLGWISPIHPNDYVSCLYPREIDMNILKKALERKK